MNLAETESQHMQRAAGANQHRAEHGSARRGRRNALTDPRLVRSTGHVMALDFDPTVVGIASQPFWLSWRDDAGQLSSHAPDFFARRADDTSVVVEMQAGRGLAVSTGAAGGSGRLTPCSARSAISAEAVDSQRGQSAQLRGQRAARIADRHAVERARGHRRPRGGGCRRGLGSAAPSRAVAAAETGENR